MNLKNIHNVYFVGIGGMGMSAVARYFASNGKKVAGYDRIPSQITLDLENLGAVSYTHLTLPTTPYV